MNIPEEERIKVNMYNGFYKENEELFKQNPQEYAFRQRVYVEKKFEKIKYNLKRNE